MTQNYTDNKVVSVDNNVFIAVAGKNYKKGDIVDKTKYINDKFNGIFHSFFKKTDIVPLGIVTHYQPTLANNNVVLSKLDEKNKRIIITASKDISKGDALSLKTEINNNSINHLVFKNYIAKSKVKDGGDGMFAGKNYSKGDIISINTFVDCYNNNDTLKDYVFTGRHGRPITIQGDISIMNHDDNPNVNPYNFDHNKRVATAIASRDIKMGEELFVSYGKEWWKKRQNNKEENKEENKEPPPPVKDSKEATVIGTNWCGFTRKINSEIENYKVMNGHKLTQIDCANENDKKKYKDVCSLANAFPVTCPGNPTDSVQYLKHNQCVPGYATVENHKILKNIMDLKSKKKSNNNSPKSEGGGCSACAERKPSPKPAEKPSPKPPPKPPQRTPRRHPHRTPHVPAPPPIYGNSVNNANVYSPPSHYNNNSNYNNDLELFRDPSQMAPYNYQQTTYNRQPPPPPPIPNVNNYRTPVHITQHINRRGFTPSSYHPQNTRTAFPNSRPGMLW